jgi:nucleotide-binding universal stress UspA family protein
VTCIPERARSILATLWESICSGLKRRPIDMRFREKAAHVVHWRMALPSTAGERRGVMRVLIAVDDSGFAEYLPRAVLASIRHENTEVLVLHVLQPVDTAPPPEMAQGYAPELEGEQQPAHALVERIAAELRRVGFAVQTRVRIGDVATTILDQGAEWHTDLIVVGSHGQRSIHDFLLGSVAESVARRAGCSVAIVRTAVGNK